MISQRARFLFPWIIVLFFVNTARAHEGPPYPLFVDQTVGSYVVSLWSDPDVGDVLFYVILNNPQSGLPPDVSVQVGVGGVNVARMGAQLANVPRGGSVWTFALVD